MEQILLQAILKYRESGRWLETANMASPETSPAWPTQSTSMMEGAWEELQMLFIWISGPFQAKPFFDFEIALNPYLL